MPGNMKTYAHERSSSSSSSFHHQEQRARLLDSAVAIFINASQLATWALVAILSRLGVPLEGQRQVLAAAAAAAATTTTTTTNTNTNTNTTTCCESTETGREHRITRSAPSPSSCMTAMLNWALKSPSSAALLNLRDNHLLFPSPPPEQSREQVAP